MSIREESEVSMEHSSRWVEILSAAPVCFKGQDRRRAFGATIARKLPDRVTSETISPTFPVDAKRLGEPSFRRSEASTTPDIQDPTSPSLIVLRNWSKAGS